jgi:hypothetical protein
MNELNMNLKVLNAFVLSLFLLCPDAVWAQTPCTTVLSCAQAAVAAAAQAQADVQALSARVKTLEDENASLQQRLSNIKLKATSLNPGPTYSCLGLDKAPAASSPDATVVMYGLKEGGGCRENNQNYYVELSVDVPTQ